ncbi:MAG: Ig-like domain-containing protein [Anaerolineaceae bacterium]|nr:Ig-like domain-containing protein [Anaerolineaceae bacterium]
MRKYPLLILVSILLLGFSFSGATAYQETASAVPLQVIDSQPFPGQELGLNSPVVLYFDQPLDCATAQGTVSLSPALPGDVTCDAGSGVLTFTPGVPYERATEYTLTVSTALRGQDSAALPEPYSLTLNTLGYLAVSDFLPADNSTGIETSAVITVIFNRPVVPLVTVEDMSTLPSPITIVPSVAGTGEWLNTSIYVFRPETALAGGTSYTVSVNDSLQAIDGSTLAAPVKWSFTTVDPAVLETSPRDQASDVDLDDTIRVTFNQPMDQASVESGFYVRPIGQTDGAITGQFAWSEAGTTFTFQPDSLLALNEIFVAGFQTPPRAITGTATLTGFSQWTFATVPYPAIIGTDPFDGQTNVSPYGNFTIYFASPMDRSTILDKITIEPAPWRDPDGYYSSYNDSYNLNFPVEPSTTYTITIAPGMADRYGNTIDTPLTVRYTNAPYDPDFNLRVPGDVGLYNAYNDTTQLFITHRNLNQLNLELYSVPTQTFTGQILANAYGPAYNFMPNPATLLRKWQMDVSGPLNTLSYELLDLSADAGTTAACPGAPASRLKVGDTAIVITDPDPVRARQTPPDGEIVTLLYKDYRLPIVGGPVCANDAVWWEVELRDQGRVWVAEGLGDEYFLNLLVAGQTTPVTVTSGPDTGALAPGIYLLRVSSPLYRNNEQVSHFLLVATANVTLKYQADGVLVWATDMETGLPIPNAQVTIYDEAQTYFQVGTTDADGLARIAIPRVSNLYKSMVAVVKTDSQFGVGLANWSDGVDPWNFDQNSNFYPEQYAAYVYTDRPIYRPDQPVYFRGVVRQRDDVTYTLPPFDTIPVKIYDDQGDVVYEKDLPLTPFGTFSDTFQLDAEAGLGYYRVEATLPTTDPDSYYAPSGSVGFSVAEFRLPEFQVNVTPEQDAVVQSDIIKVAVDSAYYFGGAVSNADVNYSVVSNPYFFRYDGPGYYDFTDYNYDEGPGAFYGGYSSQVASGEGTTDDKGNLIIEIPADLEDDTQSQQFTIEATVADESQQVVAGRTSVIVHKGLVYIGLRPQRYVSTAGQEAGIDIISVDWNSEAVAGQSIDVEVVERRWSNVQEEDESGRTIWTWEVEEIPVTTGSVTTDADGKASFTFTPPNGGIFKTKITTRDSRGNEVVSSTTMWVSSREYVSWRQQNSNRIDLIADQESYNVGDTAEILITSPWQGSADALVTVERGGVLKAEHLTLDSNSYVYRLPITPDFAPNVYVSVLLMKGVDENNPVASFRMGLIQLGVNNEQKEITIAITPDREQTGPRETVTYTVQTTNYTGAPVQAEVGVSLTDLASLSIADPNTGPILSFFYGQQGLSVRTASTLTINADQLTQTVLDTIKGGGGGGGEAGIFDIRGEFVDTAYWNATLITGADGTATFDVTLPDNLTTWRLDARAVTSGADGLTLVGQDTFDILSTKPLLIRPVTPRFFVVDDQVVLAAVVNNNTGQDMQTEIFIEGSGFTFNGDAHQTFTIPAGGRQRVEWPVTVQDVSAIDVTFFANGGNGTYTDASKPPLGQGDARLIPVYKYEVPETVGTGGLLREGGSRTEAISLPRRFDVTQGELTIKIDPSLAATTIDGLDYLRNYPYQCVEQTVSRFLPNIMTYQALNRLNVANPELEQQLNSGVNFALQRLFAQQKVDGGWGWFVNDVSNPVTTAYALIGLAEARDAGFAVSDNVISRAQSYLRTTFITPGPNIAPWRLNRQAFTLYALARSGAPDIARTATLYDSRARLSLYAEAYLALTFSYINTNDTSRTDVLVSDLVNAAILSATGAHWEEGFNDYWNWNSNTRTTAIVLDALVKLRPQSDLLPNVVRWLMIARKADAWETTQETAWAVMALTDWMVLTGELQPDYQYSASLNDSLLTQGTATPETVRDSVKLVVEVSDLLHEEANRLVIGRTDGPGVLYYTAHLRAFLPVPEVEPLNRGIIIDRRYVIPGTDTPVTEARVGDLIEVRLTVIAPNALHYVVIEDPIPAGTEGVNPNLNTEQQVGTRPGLDVHNPLSRGWGWWWFSNIEFHDEKVVLYSTYLPAGTYEYVYSIRAGLEGTYNVIPPTGQEFYFPEVYGRGAGSVFTVLPAE